MMRRGCHPFWSLFAAVVLLLLAVPGCNLRMGGGTEDVTPTATIEASPLPQPIEIAYEPGIGSLVPWIDQSYLVFVPGGEFIMGKDEDMPSDHAPQHTVSVDSFWIHQTEVTNNQYTLCVAAGVCLLPYRTTGLPFWYASPVRGLDPVVGVSWEQAATYCEWIEGRLPTEAEWEKAARGTEGDPYPWGEEEPTCNLLNFDGCQEIDQPVRVRSFLDGASPFLLADTAGNVAEWVGDWYDEEVYATSPVNNPTGPASGTNRVVRGSSYTPSTRQNTTGMSASAAWWEVRRWGIRLRRCASLSPMYRQYLRKILMNHSPLPMYQAPSVRQIRRPEYHWVM
jgi:formylglycine-generating enzyme required for sulfatase activity